MRDVSFSPYLYIYNFRRQRVQFFLWYYSDILLMHREFTQLLCFRTKSFAFETPNFAYVHMCRSPKEQSEKEYSCSSSREREEVKKSEFFPAVNIYSPSTVQYLCLLNTILKQFRIHSVISHFGNLNAKTRSMLVVLYIVISFDLH